MKVCRFNREGCVRFGAYLDALAAQQDLPVPADLLTDSSVSETISDAPDIEPQVFADRMELAAFLDSLLEPAHIERIESDIGLWAWLSLFYFDQLCPADGDGDRAPGKRAKWLPEIQQSRRYYRHMLLGPYLVYRAHRDNPSRALALLSDPVTVSTSEVYRMLVENPSLGTSRAAVEATTVLYYDKEKKRLRRGSGTKGPGGSRRLIQVLQQFDCTYDLGALTSDRLLALLPGEFQRFRG
jgi:hypothetical protein